MQLVHFVVSCQTDHREIYLSPLFQKQRLCSTFADNAWWRSHDLIRNYQRGYYIHKHVDLIENSDKKKFDRKNGSFRQITIPSNVIEDLHSAVETIHSNKSSICHCYLELCWSKCVSCMFLLTLLWWRTIQLPHACRNSNRYYTQSRLYLILSNSERSDSFFKLLGYDKRTNKWA